MFALIERASSMREFAVRPGRAPIEMRVDVKAGETSFAATTTNIGVGGLFLATERQLQVGDRLTVQLAMPGHVQPVAVGAEVRWLRMSDNRSSGMGLRFVNPSLLATVAIIEVLQNRARP